MCSARILIIATNVDQFEDSGFRTGLWLGELTHFWDVAEAAGLELHIASPLGGKVPLDPESIFFSRLKNLFGVTDSVMQRYRDKEFMNRLNNTLKISDVSADNYDAIYLTGGHGVMFDFPQCAALAELTAKFWESGKIVSAVCHGVAGLLEVKLRDGRYLIEKKNVTGFSWVEEKFAGREECAPFSLETELQRRGAVYKKCFPVLEPLWSFVVSDGSLITGQNPRSARKVGKAVVKELTRFAVRPPQPQFAHAA